MVRGRSTPGARRWVTCKVALKPVRRNVSFGRLRPSIVGLTQALSVDRGRVHSSEFSSPWPRATRNFAFEEGSHVDW